MVPDTWGMLFSFFSILTVAPSTVWDSQTHELGDLAKWSIMTLGLPDKHGLLQCNETQAKPVVPGSVSCCVKTQ